MSLHENVFVKPVAKVCSLAERISRILCTPELELDGNAYKGKYELDNGKSIKKFILDELRKVYTNQSTGNNIKVSRESAKELLLHWKSDGEAFQKSIAHIPQIIESMQFLEEMSPDPNRVNPRFAKYSYYITQAKIDGESYIILSTVGYKGHEIYYDQNGVKGIEQ
ncbi:MAG: hypothetical protein LBB36_01910 [Fibromonadaceae bacterium]|jgi:hypothetical protein|nr:hypothetical protein [Fibromonadaceae bacterium]